MKKIFILVLITMLSAAETVTGKVRQPKTKARTHVAHKAKANTQNNKQVEEEEIGNFDFLYYDSENYDVDVIRAENLMNEAFSHLGARYRLGSKGPNVFDCSGFTSYVYKQRTDIFIGGTSRDQYARNIPITREQLQCGDLVFFTSPHSGRNVGHVGIVVDVDPLTHNFSFIHASSTSGVKVSQISESNYAKRYIGARRVRE